MANEPIDFEYQFQEDYYYACKRYEKHFCEGTLERMVLPLGADQSEEFNVKETIKKLNKAVETNEQIEQAPPHIWKNIIF